MANDTRTMDEIRQDVRSRVLRQLHEDVDREKARADAAEARVKTLEAELKKIREKP